TPHSPQGHPVFMQAGASERGLTFAARWAEAVFTHQQEGPIMQAFYSDLKGRMAAFGREANECAILPSIEVFVGETESAAQAKADKLDSYAFPAVGLAVINQIIGHDVSDLPLDTPLSQIEVGPNGP